MKPFTKSFPCARGKLLIISYLLKFQSEAKKKIISRTCDVKYTAYNHSLLKSRPPNIIFDYKYRQIQKSLQNRQLHSSHLISQSKNWRRIDRHAWKNTIDELTILMRQNYKITWLWIIDLASEHKSSSTQSTQVYTILMGTGCLIVCIDDAPYCSTIV